METETKYIII